MKRDGVSLALDLVLEEIAAVEAQLTHEGRTAFEQNRYDDARRLAESGKRLSVFARKLAALQKEWTSGIDPQTRSRVKVGGYPPRKGPRTTLRVTLSGRVFQRPTAAATMVDVIESLGVDRVRALGHRVSGMPLISTEKHEKYGQMPLGPFLVCTHSNTEAKKRLLERLGAELGRAITVDVIAP